MITFRDNLKKSKDWYAACLECQRVTVAEERTATQLLLLLLRAAVMKN